MDSRAAAAVCLVLILAAATISDVNAASAEPQSIVSGPPNVAIQIDQPVDFVLPCTATEPPPNVRVSWVEYVTRIDGGVISDGYFVLPGHPNADRYSILTNNVTQYDLRINPILLQDGGTYRCVDVNEPTTPGYAQVITIERAPNCTTNIPASGYVREDQYYTMECSLTYQGKVAPTLQFLAPFDFSQTTVKTNATVWSGFRINMTRYMDAYTFDVLANFTEEGFIQTNFASNVPTWSYTYSSPSLIVQWEPKYMYRVPEQDTYDIGTEVQCQADANPSATYFWQNMDTHETWTGNRLYASDALVGSQTMRCNAQNNISGVIYTKDYFFTFVVNPRTTTPKPTTLPTTTTVAPELPCDDLTGRWNANEPHFVDMCLEINNTNYGRLIGVVRNATDPYFIEVRGRIAPYKYNQVGFTGIWPVNIGTVTFLGTCKKCYGEELLVVNGVARVGVDNVSCEDPGGFRIIQTYVFRRVGPPCRGRSGQQTETLLQAASRL